MRTIFNELNQKVFEGTVNECRAWLLDKAYTFASGAKAYKAWTENWHNYFQGQNEVYHYDGVISLR